MLHNMHVLTLVTQNLLLGLSILSLSCRKVISPSTRSIRPGTSMKDPFLLLNGSDEGQAEVEQFIEDYGDKVWNWKENLHEYLKVPELFFSELPC